MSGFERYLSKAYREPNSTLGVSVEQSVPIPVVESFSDRELVYGEALAVASGATQDILSYTVPVTQQFNLSRVIASGQNIAIYRVLINGIVKAVLRSGWISFNVETQILKQLNAGDIIRIEVENFRPSVSDFNATIMGDLL